MPFWDHNEHRIGFSPSAKYKLAELVHKPSRFKARPCRREMGRRAVLLRQGLMQETAGCGWRWG